MNLQYREVHRNIRLSKALIRRKENASNLETGRRKNFSGGST
jgi:hypothetical protein